MQIARIAGPAFGGIIFGFYGAIASSSIVSAVVAVGSWTHWYNVPSYSNAGSWISLVAPGENIVSAYMRAIMYSWVGNVNGFAFCCCCSRANSLAVNPTLVSAEVKDVLQSSASDVLAAGFDNSSGYGVVNAHAA